MNVDAMATELGNVLSMPQSELVRKGLLALIEKEIRLAEQEIADIRERYDAFSKAGIE